MYQHLSIDVVSDKQSSSESISSMLPVVSKSSIKLGLKSFFEAEVCEIKCEKCDDGTKAFQTL
jgi:Zn finger protein HypA/HybF involved in hydrogenase expression